MFLQVNRWSRVALHRWTGADEDARSCRRCRQLLGTEKGLAGIPVANTVPDALFCDLAQTTGPQSGGTHSVTHISPSRRRKPRVGLQYLCMDEERSENKSLFFRHGAIQCPCMERRKQHVCPTSGSPRLPNSIEMLRPVW